MQKEKKYKTSLVILLFSLDDVYVDVYIIARQCNRSSNSSSSTHTPQEARGITKEIYTFFKSLCYRNMERERERKGNAANDVAAP